MVASPPLPAGDSSSARASRTSGLAVTSLVLGLLSFFLFFITSIPGLICGIMGLKRIARSQAGGADPRLTGRGLAIAGIVLSTITTLASVVLGLLVWPAFQAARDSAAQWNTVNNFKQIMLAMHTAEQGTKAFPAAIVDADNKPLLSWRVAILPFLADEQAAQLFAEFHLDEPWDSDHNKTLIPRMPAVFASLRRPASSGLTDVVVPAGPGMAFSEPEAVITLKPAGKSALAGVPSSAFADGMSKTAFVLEIPGVEVPWTKPADSVGDLAAVWATLKQNGIRRVVVGTADAAVSRIRTDTSPESVRALFSKAGGDVAEIED